MDTEPVNPFQSPQAEDGASPFVPKPLRWRQLLVAMMIVPAAMPIALVVQLAVGASVLGMSLDPLAIFKQRPDFLLVPYFLALVGGLPIVAYLRWSNRLTPAYVLSIGGVLIAVTTLLFLAMIVPSAYRESSALGVRMLVLTTCTLTSLFAPVALFALYLSYRRRDQTRGGEPRG